MPAQAQNNVFNPADPAQDPINRVNAAIEQSNFAMRVIAEEHQAWVIAENNKRKPNFDDLALLFINIVGQVSRADRPTPIGPATTPIQSAFLVSRFGS